MGRKAVRANSVDNDAYQVADAMAAGLDMNRLKIGRTSDELTLISARLLDEDVHGAADAAPVEFPLLAGKRLLQPREP